MSNSKGWSDRIVTGQTQGRRDGRPGCRGRPCTRASEPPGPGCGRPTGSRSRGAQHLRLAAEHSVPARRPAPRAARIPQPPHELQVANLGRTLIIEESIAKPCSPHSHLTSSVRPRRLGLRDELPRHLHQQLLRQPGPVPPLLLGGHPRRLDRHRESASDSRRGRSRAPPAPLVLAPLPGIGAACEAPSLSPLAGLASCTPPGGRGADGQGCLIRVRGSPSRRHPFRSEAVRVRPSHRHRRRRPAA